VLVASLPELLSFLSAGAATSEYHLSPPGVVSINVELGNGPADEGHDGLKKNLELAVAQGVQPGAVYEMKAVPGTAGLDLDKFNAAQAKWYAEGGEIVRGAGFIPVLLTFISPAEEGVEGVVHAHYASSVDKESAKGLDHTVKFLQLGGAAGVKAVVGPGTVDQHFNKDTVQLYDRWGNNLTDKILPVAEKEGVILAPESLRKRESTALSDVKLFGDYVKEIGSPYFKMQLDTAHLRAEYGKDYLKVLEEAIKDDLVAHLHISEWGPWDTEGNRAVISADTPIGSEMKELFDMLKRVKYKGTIGIEVPHPLFYGAVGRNLGDYKKYTIPGADPTNVLGRLAEEQQGISVRHVNKHYKAA